MQVYFGLLNFELETWISIFLDQISLFFHKYFPVPVSLMLNIPIVWWMYIFSILYIKHLKNIHIYKSFYLIPQVNFSNRRFKAY